VRKPLRGNIKHTTFSKTWLAGVFYTCVLHVQLTLCADEWRTGALRYTTFSWLVSVFCSCPPAAGIHCPNATYKADVTAAIKRNELTWNAFPFNSDVTA
jgi:hypothetical protein